MKKRKKKNSENKILYSVLGIATGAIAAGTYALLNKDKLFKKKEKNSLNQLKDIVQKSKTNVEDILKKMNENVSNVKENGKAKMDKVL